jgi:Ca2+-binding EF-hand superfamily protein
VRGLPFEEFKTVARLYEQKNYQYETLLMQKYFSAIDTRERGFIDCEDVRKAVKKVAPRLADKHAERLFSALDSLDIGKVTLFQFSSVLKNSLSDNNL